MTTSEQKMGRVLTVKLQISAAVESLQRYCCRNDTVVYGLRHVSSVAYIDIVTGAPDNSVRMSRGAACSNRTKDLKSYR